MDLFNENSYLQSQINNNISPRLIKRVVQSARLYTSTSIKKNDFETSQDLLSEQPDLPIANFDITRSTVAYGNKKIPVLNKQLNINEPEMAFTTLATLSDLVHNPQYAFEAIKLKIPEKVIKITVSSNNQALQTQSLVFLQNIATTNPGKEVLVKHNDFLNHLKLKILNPEENNESRLQIASCLEEIASFWKTGEVLVDKGFIQNLLNALLLEQNIGVILKYLQSLKWLMYGIGKEIALENNALETLMALCQNIDSSIVVGACECLMMLTMSYQSQQIVFKRDLLNLVNKLLHNDIPEIYTAAASVLMFCTIDFRAKLCAQKMEQLSDRLLVLSKSFLNKSLQVFAIKALMNLCEHPLIRAQVLKKYQDVLDIQVDDKIVMRYKKDLIQVVKDGFK